MVITQYKKDSYKERLICPGVTGFQACWPSGAARHLFYPGYSLSFWVSLIKQPTFNVV